KVPRGRQDGSVQERFVSRSKSDNQADTFHLATTPRCPARCLPAAQSARIHARRLKSSNLSSFEPGARKSRGVVHLIGWPRNGTRFSARSLLCPRLDSGDPPDALAALSRTI